jgi:penicillin-binding protein 1C
MHEYVHRMFTRAKRVAVGVGIGLCLGAGLLTASLRVLPVPPWPPAARMVLDADGQLLGAVLSADAQWRLPTRRADVSPELVRILLAKEDRWFYAHPGLNPAAIVRAAWQNIIQGRRVSGASTLTMQLARMLEPGERTFAKKLREAARAVQLEWRYSKEELLEAYLTLAPCGGNVQGFAGAAWRYYGQSATGLSLAQSLTLVLLPSRPTRLQPGRADAELLALRNTWIRRLLAEGLITDADASTALDEALGLGYHALPRQAPHLVRRLLAANPTLSRVPSTLRAGLQQQAESTVRSYVARLRNYQVSTAAALIVRLDTREVWAYVGSADFDDGIAQGQVDGVTAVRSPGSTLKPLIYALAFEQGLITPHTVLLDVPTRFGGGYEPENYDEKFNGTVTARLALERSLNVPAVRVLEQVGVERFTEALGQAGFRQVQADAGRLGLSAALGGCGVRLEELVGLYAALANSGNWQPLRLSPEEASQEAVSIITPAAAWMTSDILTSLTRPDLPNNFQNATRLPRIAWKTGTSYGRRDAWAVGFTAEFAIGVWVGNFSGVGSPALSGADVATPLLFQLAQSLPRSRSGGWLAQPPEVLPRTVCSRSGALPDTFCHDLVSDSYVQGRAPYARCRHLAPVWLSVDQRTSYTAACAPPTATRKLYPNPEPELTAWPDYTREGPEPPPLSPSCLEASTGVGPRIVTPADGAVYYFRRRQVRRLALRAAAPADAGRLHWFANGNFLGSCAPDSTYGVLADTGRVVLTVTDARARSHRISVRVAQF